MNAKELIHNKTAGFYVGAASCVLALITLFIYIGMGSMFFSGLVVAGLLVGIAAFVAASVFNFRIGVIFSYVCYIFAMYHFMVLEIDYRMDVLVDAGVGGLDGIFVVACVFILLTIITGIVSSCMKQQKTD